MLKSSQHLGCHKFFVYKTFKVQQSNGFLESKGKKSHSKKKEKNKNKKSHKTHAKAAGKTSTILLTSFDLVDEA